MNAPTTMMIRTARWAVDRAMVPAVSTNETLERIAMFFRSSTMSTPPKKYRRTA